MIKCVDGTYMLTSHTLDEDFGVLVDENVWLRLLGVSRPIHRVHQSALFWRGDVLVDHSSLDNS